MNGLPLAGHIRELDEAGALRLAQSLALAERSVLSLPPEVVDFPQRTKAKDGGVDGRTSFPADAATSFPTGLRLWQVKSGRSPLKVDREFSTPKAGGEKWVVRELAKGDAGYVLFWTHDPVDPDAEAIRRAFREAIDRIAPGASVTFLFLSQIVDLVRRHPGIALSALGLDGEGILAPAQWRKQFEGSFQSDPHRDTVIEELRRHAATAGAGRAALRVYGDAGVGRSRTVFEAINVDGLRERAVIATRASSTVVPEMVASDPEASVVLVLDPATESDIAAVQPFIAAAEGRLVVIAVQERDGSEPAHAGHLIVPPLDAGAIRRLINPENDATKADEGLVTLAGGYPGLAMQIGEVIRRREPGAELLSVARDPDVRRRLSRLVPDKEGRDALAALAPFGRVGFSGEARRELMILTKALALDDLIVSAQLDRYEGRLLTRSGDYRRVSPDIVAAWLSEEAFTTFGQRAVEAGNLVPERLAVSLLDRLATMPGSQAAVRIAKELAQLDRFKATAVTDVDVVRGRMLVALAVLAPTVGLEHVRVVLASEGDERPGMWSPDLLYAIEELLWVHETHEPALQLLFELARADGSTNTYGPRNVFEQSFQLVLSGTREAYADRVAIARRLASDSDDAGRRLIAAALGGAFDFSATRGLVLRGRVSSRDDWYPSSDQDWTDSLTAAWNLLVELAQDPAAQPAAGRSVAHAVRACLRVGIGASIERDLPGIKWAAASRAQLLHEMRLARDHDDGLSDEHRELLGRVMLQLEGDAFGSRLDTAMGAEPYQLEPYTETGATTFLDRLAEEMLTDLAALGAAVRASHDGNAQTVQLLFYKLGALADDHAYARLLDPPASAPARIGFIAARDRAGSSEWATERMRDWLADPAWLVHVPALVRSAVASDERADLAVDAVAAGADPFELSLLVYGSRVQPLGAATIVRIIEALEGREGIILEHALGIVAYWLEVADHTASPDLVTAALRLVDASLEDDGPSHAGMVELYRSLILHRIPEDVDTLLPRVMGILRSSDRLNQESLNLVCRAAALDASATADAMIGLVAEAIAGTGARMWAWRLSRVRLLSVLAGCTDAEFIAERLVNAGIEQLATLFRHVAVTTGDGSLDPMFAKLLQLGGEDKDVWSAAAWAFEHPEDVVWGAESAHIRSRADAAGEIAVSSDGPLIQRWASWTNGQLTERAKEAERREANGEDD